MSKFNWIKKVAVFGIVASAALSLNQLARADESDLDIVDYAQSGQVLGEKRSLAHYSGSDLECQRDSKAELDTAVLNSGSSARVGARSAASVAN
jgi:hypothetical protein